MWLLANFLCVSVSAGHLQTEQQRTQLLSLYRLELWDILLKFGHILTLKI